MESSIQQKAQSHHGESLYIDVSGDTLLVDVKRLVPQFLPSQCRLYSRRENFECLDVFQNQLVNGSKLSLLLVLCFKAFDDRSHISADFLGFDCLAGGNICEEGATEIFSTSQLCALLSCNKSSFTQQYVSFCRRYISGK